MLIGSDINRMGLMVGAESSPTNFALSLDFLSRTPLYITDLCHLYIQPSDRQSDNVFIVKVNLMYKQVSLSISLAYFFQYISIIYIRICGMWVFGQKFKHRSIEIRSLDFVDFWVCWSMGLRVSGACPWSSETIDCGGQ